MSASFVSTPPGPHSRLTAVHDAAQPCGPDMILIFLFVLISDHKMNLSAIFHEFVNKNA